MSNQERNQEFGFYLNLVLGQAIQAAGYEKLLNEINEDSGKYIYSKQFTDATPMLQGLYAFIEFQNLIYVTSEWAPNAVSRFTVFLTRSDSELPHLKSDDPDYVQCMLSELVVRGFSVDILPTAKHWWSYQEHIELCNALAEAGHLLAGYGIPWLDEQIFPPSQKIG